MVVSIWVETDEKERRKDEEEDEKERSATHRFRTWEYWMAVILTLWHSIIPPFEFKSRISFMRLMQNGLYVVMGRPWRTTRCDGRRPWRTFHYESTRSWWTAYGIVEDCLGRSCWLPWKIVLIILEDRVERSLGRSWMAIGVLADRVEHLIRYRYQVRSKTFLTSRMGVSF